MVRYVIIKDVASASESSNCDSNDGRDDSANKVFHLIEMHQLFIE